MIIESKQYRRRAVVVNSMQVLGENIEKVAFWCGGQLLEIPSITGTTVVGVSVPTLQGVREAYFGDFVVKRGDGSFWTYTTSEFASKFESVD